MANGQDGTVANPTYMGNIRYFFEPDDIDHMQQKGIDLGSYAGVKDHAVQIYSAVKAGWMPPDASRRWQPDRVQTFLDWMTAGYPLGVPATDPPAPPVQPGGGTRIRKDVATLSDAEATLLVTAFQGLFDRAPDDPDGYFMLAGEHGLPDGYCQHHNDPFNPWHRVYLKQFEDALRSVDGCGDVTLPYWDIAKPIPPLLMSGALSGYTFPKPVGPYAAGDRTERYGQARIDANLAQYDFFGDVSRSLRQARWGAYGQSGYQLFSIQAHDSGHMSTGPTMANQNVASYDPIFWLYHCNLDRFWLSWQAAAHATDWTSFQSLLDDRTFWQAPLNVIEPFTTTTDQTIAFGISYEEPAVTDQPLENQVRSMAAAKTFSIASDSQIAVRVENIARLNVPGSFTVHLLADGEPIASRAFFQPEQPKGCATCATVPTANLEFRVDPAKVLDKTLSVKIEVPGQEAIGAVFPIASVGAPTIRANLLLDER